jgi:hypothetical protein
MMTALWDTAPCSFVEVDVSDVLTASIIMVFYRPEDGGSRNL